MLDGLKGWSGSGRAERQGSELETLIVAAREERAALSALLAQISLRAAKLPQMDASLQAFSAQIAGLTSKLAEVSGVVQRLDDRATIVRGLEQRTDTLVNRINEAQRVVDQLSADHADLLEYRSELGEISGDATALQNSLLGLKEENRSLEQDLQQSKTGLDESLTLSARLAGELEQVRAAAVELADRYAALTDGTRQARDEAAAAAAAATGAAATVREQLAAVEQLKDLDRTTGEKLRALRVLAEDVERKTAAVREQQPRVDQALAQSAQIQAMATTAAELSRSVQALQQQKPALDDAVARVNHLADVASAVERLARQVEEAQERAGQARSTAEHVAGSVERLSATATQLTQDYAALREGSTQAQNQAAAAIAAAVDAGAGLRDKVAAMDRLSEAARGVDDKVRQLVALAGQADQRAAALVEQQPLVERALQQAAQVHDLAATAADLSRSMQALQRQNPAIDEALAKVTHLTGVADAVERLGTQVEEAHARTAHATEVAADVTAAVEGLKATATQLTQDYAVLRESSSQAHTQAAAAAAAAVDASASLREKLAAMDRLHEVGRSTDEKMRQLIALAEQADRKTTTLFEQQPLVERALQQSAQVHQLAASAAELGVAVAALQQRQPQIDAAVSRIDQIGDIAGAVERLHQQVDTTRASLAESQSMAGEVNAAVGTVRAMAGQLAHEYAGLREVSRQARDEAAAATAAAADAAASVREKLAAMEMLNHLGRATDEKLRGLQSIAEQVDRKAIDLQAQQPLVERALDQAARVRELSDIAAALTRSLDALHQQQPRIDQALARAGQLEDMAGAIERLARGLDATRAGMADTTGLAADVQVEVNAVRNLAQQLAGDYDGLQEASRQTAEGARAAADTLQAVQHRLGEVEQIGELRRSVDEQFTNLEALGQDAARTLDALHAFTPSYDTAVQQTRTLTELNTAADARIDAMNGGLERAARLDALLVRLEALESETEARVGSVAGVRDECAKAVRWAEEDTRSLVQALNGDVQQFLAQVAAIKGDLDAADRQRASLATLTEDVEQLMARARQAEQQASSALAHRQGIADMETNLTFLTRLLNTVRADLKSIGERKALIDGFAQKVSSVEASLQQAQQVLGTLNSERQLAERIEQSLRQLRTRTMTAEPSTATPRL